MVDHKIFKTKRLGPGRKREATAVVHNPFNERGELIAEFHVPDGAGSDIRAVSIVTIFSGRDGGKSEAEKLCEMLNFAYQCFHSGSELEAH